MIAPTMALAAIGGTRAERIEFARDARIARLAALVLDTFFFSVLSALLDAVYGVTQVTSGTPPPTIGFSSYGTQTTISWLALTLVYLGYFMVMEALFGATPGKAICRLRVVRLDGRPLAVGAVVVRNVLRFGDALPILYLLGGIAVLLTPGSQRLGDLAAGTTVVYRHRALEPGATRASTPTAKVVFAFWVMVAIAFSAFFSYFGRPPLAIEGMFNVRQLLDPSITSYSLGEPAWSWGRVVYPIAATEPGKNCSGTLELRWEWAMGWQMSSGELDCFPAS